MKTLDAMNIPAGLILKYKLQALRDYTIANNTQLDKKRIVDGLVNAAYTINEETNSCSVDTVALEAFLNENQ